MFIQIKLNHKQYYTNNLKKKRERFFFETYTNKFLKTKKRKREKSPKSRFHDCPSKFQYVFLWHVIQSASELCIHKLHYIMDFENTYYQSTRGATSFTALR